MRNLRLILLPFSLIYGIITGLRNWCYDRGIFSSHVIPVKSICIGNLSVGGTGKTPLTDYLISYFLEKKRTVATLSRGYGRKSRGAILASVDSTAAQIGDEPMMYHLRHGDTISVAVAEKRQEGVEMILADKPATDLILLDDAFQHRAVSAGLNVLVTDFNHLYSGDFLLPAGNLREPKRGSRRAHAIMVTKCPSLSENQKNDVRAKLKSGSTPVFFSHIEYNALVPFNGQAIPPFSKVLLITGIGRPEPLFEQLKSKAEVEHIAFRDHHVFTAKDIDSIHEKFDSFASRDKIIVTTEKDYMRIREVPSVQNRIDQWFYLPIRIRIDNETEFNSLLDNYADKN